MHYASDLEQWRLERDELMREIGRARLARHLQAARSAARSHGGERKPTGPTEYTELVSRSEWSGATRSRASRSPEKARSA
jgi:hypothetical protein